ncbi:transcriptional regulator, LacI family [Ruminococcus sp. YE71]|uniref:LacI family DNA-binding transcriptional regulator n=1 Tax=unclassified Ruminococcus TaxID=2608920 RepID=UPI00088E7A26|nr:MULTISPECIES: LacI family DNA-binding transcriptional regulator [unclassified Ruminococcus]SDA30589.1 transcriptional regulator, LacI family [Ruminococcus sp. YE78]SFW50155.1 transcriptional regulator, LacI family [Ruminococcus sp. YE71]
MSLKQIAKMTGVSVSTVGRILSDPNHKCSNEEVRQRVLEAAREISYIPNASARSLRAGGKTDDRIFHINILLTRFAKEAADPFYDELLMILEKELRNSGCIVGNVWHCAEFSDEKYNQTDKLQKLTDSLYSDSERRSDGLIIIGKVTGRALKQLKTREKNIVSINRNSTNYEVDEVLCDGGRIAQNAVAHLAKLGHTKIGYVGDCHNESRFTGYQAALATQHLAPDIDYIYDTTPNEANGIAAMEYFSSLADPPTGIYCANDILAVGMIKAMGKRRARGYIPSIISSDDIDAAQYTKPMLTTIALPKNEMVKFALMLLLDRIKGGHKIVSRLEVEGTLIIRESCRTFRELTEPEYYI